MLAPFGHSREAQGVALRVGNRRNQTMTSDTHGPVISVMLAVPDATAAARWYARALGATESWNLGGVVGLTVDGAPFFLGEPADNGWDTPTALGTPTVRVEGFVDAPDTFIERAVPAAAPALDLERIAKHFPHGLDQPLPVRA